MKIYKITIDLQAVNAKEREADVKQSLQWVKSLVQSGFYLLYIKDERFKNFYVHEEKEDGTIIPTIQPFIAYSKIKGSIATIYVYSECPQAVYNLLKYYWYGHNKDVKLSCKRTYTDLYTADGYQPLSYDIDPVLPEDQ